MHRARRLGLATLIGRRTWGGEIWLSASDFTLQGGGVASAGQTGVYDTEGQEWLIEVRTYGRTCSVPAALPSVRLGPKTYNACGNNRPCSTMRD